MNFIRIFFAVSLMVGCGPPPVDHSGHGNGNGNEDAGVEPLVDAGSVDAGGVDAGAADAGLPDAGVTLPGVPVLVSVISGGHAMDITWQLPSSGCSTVALRMKPPAGAYSTVRSVTGTTTTTQYSPGHSSGTYCFQVTCSLGGSESTPSNERCASQ